MAAATARSRAPVGSAQWVLNERKQANQFVDDEIEEFGYSVRNELDWLNEHMRDVFANQQLNFNDVFKTPGKLRGKTPRTARKRNPLEARMPLTDIFAPNPQNVTSPAQVGLFSRQLPQFHVAEDGDATQPNTQSSLDAPYRSYQKPVVGLGKENTDSGYHGMTEDEIEAESIRAIAHKPNTSHSPMRSSPKKPPPSRQQNSASDVEEPQSFVSAKEDLGSKKPSREDLREESSGLMKEENLSALVAQAQNAADALNMEHDNENLRAEQFKNPVPRHIGIADTEENASGSEGPSPEKPVVRKSSFNFASLPPREPLATRISRTSHLDQNRAQSSHFGRITGGKSLGGAQNTHNGGTAETESTHSQDSQNAESQATKQHNKTSTQQLYDRITMLGLSKDSQLTKSMASSFLPSQSTSQETTLKTTMPILDDDNEEDDEDDWIAPMKPAASSSKLPDQKLSVKRSAAEMNDGDHSDNEDAELRRPRKSLTRPGLGHMKSVSTTAIPSPTRQQAAQYAANIKPISVSNPPLPSTFSTTPAGSPTGRKFTENPLSASKAKLYSVLKSAKGIFASSAGISASAKLEALSPAPPRTVKQAKNAPQGSWEELLSPSREALQQGLYYPDIQAQAEQPISAISPGKAPEVRKTRSSAERERRMEKEMKEQQRVTSDLEKAREKERQKATAFQLQQKHSKETMSESQTGITSGDEMPPPPQPKSLLPTTQTSKPKEIRRPAKPTKEPNKLKPAPMSIKVGVASQRLQPTTAALSASLNESLPHAAPQKGNAIKTAPSNTSSTSSFKTSVTSQNGRPKALEIAAKKKEQEERLAARKAEQKRELERKRAEKMEQDRVAEQQRKAAEQQRVLDAKKAAQRQAEARKLEQQRKDAQRVPSRQANDLAHAVQNEKLHSAPTHSRGDLGAAKSIARLNMIQDSTRAVPQMNPAGPAKRPRPAETDEEQQRAALQRNGPSYQQLDGSKRRRTNEEESDEESQENQSQTRQSIKAPPMRPSTHHKVDSSATLAGLLKSAASKQPHNPFAHGYMAAPPTASHTSMHKATVTTQHFLQHGKVTHPNDLAQISHGKIPFAQNPNPPAGSSYTQQSTHKTPVRTIGFAGPKSAMKSPSQFTPGETIDLPEIATDSEDSDTEDGGFNAPSWVDSPNLRELLVAQQLVDPEAVFGPIAQINMEEVFKNKDRHKRFRDRTSSANWTGTDRLTEDDKRKDREGRERMMRDGGWTYGPGL